ncbi:MAG: extracellular solute-binding protein [Caldilineaceae bacterium]|nr:extracellular solute-binding protein [Caldilineaceae bacterium]
MSEANVNLRATLSRRQALKLMGVSASAVALAACVAPSAPAGSTGAEAGAAPAQAPTSMVVAHRKEYFQEMETIFADAVKAWAAENNVDVETTVVAAEATEDFVPKTLAAVEAGNPPDFIYHVRLTQQLYFYNALQAVSDTVNQAIEAYGQPSSGHTRNNQIDGEWWAIPYINSGGGQFARRSLFEAVGIDPLTDLGTYDALRDACLAVSKPDEQIYGWGRTVNKGGDGQGGVTEILQNWGTQITNADMTELTFNSPETLAAVEWLTELYTSDKYAPALPPGVLAWTDSSNNEAYLAGNIAYTANAASVYAKAKADGNPIFEDTVVLNTAVGPRGEPLIGGGGDGQMYIPTGAKATDLAKQLALHLLNPDIFLPISLVSAGLFLPAYEAYLSMQPVIDAFTADPNLQRLSEQRQGDFVGLSDPADPNPYFDALQAQAVFNDLILEVITQGVSPADAVANAEARMRQIGEEMGATFG